MNNTFTRAVPASTSEHFRRCIGKVPAIAGLMLALLLLGSMSVAQAALRIDSAIWDGNNLVVKGTDGAGGTVSVYYGYDDPANADLLGTASVKRNGQWRLQVKSNRNNPLDPVPCAVSATLAGEMPFENFPVATWLLNSFVVSSR